MGCHHWLALYSPKEPTSPKNDLTIGVQQVGTLVLRRELQSPRSSTQWPGEVRLEEEWILQGGEGEVETGFEKEQAYECWGGVFGERVSGMRWSVEVSLVAKALCKYNRASVHHFNALAPCQSNSLCAHTCTHTSILLSHQVMQRNAVINFPIIITSILHVILLAFEFNSTLKANSSTFCTKVEIARHGEFYPWCRSLERVNQPRVQIV